MADPKQLGELLADPRFSKLDNSQRRKFLTTLYPEQLGPLATHETTLGGRTGLSTPDDELQHFLGRAEQKFGVQPADARGGAARAQAFGESVRGGAAAPDYAEANRNVARARGVLAEALPEQQQNWDLRPDSSDEGPNRARELPKELTDRDRQELEYLRQERAQALKSGDAASARILERNMERIAPRAAGAALPDDGLAQVRAGVRGGPAALGALAAGLARTPNTRRTVEGLSEQAPGADMENLAQGAEAWARRRQEAGDAEADYVAPKTLMEHLMRGGGEAVAGLPIAALGPGAAALLGAGELAPAIGFGAQAFLSSSDRPLGERAKVAAENFGLGLMFPAGERLGRLPRAALVGAAAAKLAGDQATETERTAAAIEMGGLAALAARRGDPPGHQRLLRELEQRFNAVAHDRAAVERLNPKVAGEGKIEQRPEDVQRPPLWEHPAGPRVERDGDRIVADVPGGKPGEKAEFPTEEAAKEWVTETVAQQDGQTELAREHTQAVAETNREVENVGKPPEETQEQAEAKAERAPGDTVVAPGGPPEPIKYEFVEAKDLIASHSGTSFAPNPAYPAGVQERAYHRVPEEQAKVVLNADQWDPRFLYSETPTAIDGPPIVTPSGVVLGGNSRTMTVQRISEGQSRTPREKLKIEAEKAAKRFGLDPEQVKTMEAPILIRRMSREPNATESAELVRRFNETFTQDVGRVERGVSLSKSLSDDTLSLIAKVLDDAGESATLRGAFTGRGDVVKALERDGVITPQTRTRLITGSILTDEGLALLEDALMGKVIPDADLIRAMPPNWSGKIQRSIPAILRVDGDNPGDVFPRLGSLFEQAIRSEIARSASKLSLDDFLRQHDMMGTPSPSQTDPRVAAIHRLMLEEPSALAVKRRVESYANRTASIIRGQPDLLDAGATPASIFKDVFERTAEKVVAKPKKRKKKPETDQPPVAASMAERANPELVNPSWNPGPNHVGQVRPGVTNPDAPAPSRLIQMSELLWKASRKLGLAVHEAPIRMRTSDKWAAGVWWRNSGDRFAELRGGHEMRPDRPRSQPRGALSIKSWGDIQTASHEFFHALAEKYPAIRELFEPVPWEGQLSPARIAELRQVRAELNTVSYDVKNLEEGAAEWMRLWMTQEDALGPVPNATRAMVASMRELMGKDFKVLERLRDDFHEALDQSLTGIHRGDTAPLGRDPGSNPFWTGGSANRWGLPVGDEFRWLFVDRQHPLLAIERALHGNPVPDGAWEASHLLAGQSAIADGLTTKGVPEYRGERGGFGYPENATGLAEGLQDVMLSVRDQEMFFTYARMRMARELFPQRIGSSGRVIEPQDFAGLDPTISLGEYKQIAASARIAERKLFHDLGVKKAQNEIDRLAKKGSKRTAAETARMGDLSNQIAPWRARARAAEEASARLRVAHTREEYGKGKSREKKYSPEQFEAGIAGLENPRYEKAFEFLKGFNNRVLDFMEQTGVLNRETREKFRRTDYAFGLFKQFYEDDGASAIHSGAGPLAEGGKGIRTLRGSDRPERAALDSLIYGATRNIQLGLENLVKQKIVKNIFQMPGGGNFGQPVAPTAAHSSVFGSTVADRIQRLINGMKIGDPRAQAHAELLERAGIVALVRDQMPVVSEWLGQERPWGEDVMAVMYNGKPEYFQVHDKKLLSAIREFRPEVLTGIAKAFDKMRTFSQGMYIGNPEFSLMSNLRRDLVYATIGTRTGWQALSTAAGDFYHTVMQTPEYWDYIANGGGFGTRFQGHVNHEKAMRRFAARNLPSNFRLVMNPRDLMGLLRSVQPLRAGQAFSRPWEEMWKVGEFRRARARGETPTHSAFLGREINTDFAVHGHSKQIARLVRSMPFVSSMINGNDNFYRKLTKVESGGKSRRAAIAAKAAIYSMMTAGLALSYRDEEWYKRLQPWEQIAYAHADTGLKDDQGDPIIATWPQNPEMGMMSNLLRLGLGKMLDNGSQPERRYAMEALQSIWANFSISLPPPLQQVVEQSSNRSFPAMIPIEDMQMQSTMASQRFRASTPQVFRSWGELFENDPTLRDVWFASPVRAEQAFRSTFGTMGWLALYAMASMRDDGVAPNWYEHPFMRRLATSGAKSDRDWALFFDTLGKMNRTRQAISDIEEGGDEERQGRWAEEAENVDELLPSFTSAASDIRDLKDELRQLERGELDQELGGDGSMKERRRVRKNALIREMRDLTREPVEEYRQMLREGRPIPQ